MIFYDDIYVSARDAERLAALMQAHRRGDATAPDATDALAELVLEARLVPMERLPDDCVTLDKPVVYAQKPSKARRKLTVVLPEQADASQGRVSVLSPVGLALFGRRQGAQTVARMPDGRTVTLSILDATGKAEPLPEAA